MITYEQFIKANILSVSSVMSIFLKKTSVFKNARENVKFDYK